MQLNFSSKKEPILESEMLMDLHLYIKLQQMVWTYFTRESHQNDAFKIFFIPFCFSVQGKSETVSALIDLGADVNSKDNEEWTPLHYAAWFGNKPQTNQKIWAKILNSFISFIDQVARRRSKFSSIVVRM